MASLSAPGSKRPLPQIVESQSLPARFNDGGESDSGGRRHMSSSVPRTAFTPGAEKAAMKKLKQKMTFSDQSATSSAKSTPSKMAQMAHTTTDPSQSKGEKSVRKGGSFTDPIKSRHKSYQPSFVPASSYVFGGAAPREDQVVDTSDYASEGEITSSLTISSLLSKLDSVKDFLKEAEAMRVKFEEKKTEPGMMTQLNKLDKLIEQLQQQESGYLGELLRLMELDGSKFDGSEGDLDITYSEEESVEEGDEERDNEGFSSDANDPTNQVVPTDSRKPEESGDESGEEGSLSLRAQMEFEQQAKEELLALQQQKAMLTQLLEKQKQIQELETKQFTLLEMKTKAEQQLKEAEAKGVELQKLADAEAKAGQLEPDERQMVMSKLSELKDKKERVDHMTKLLQTLREDSRSKRMEADEKVSSTDNYGAPIQGGVLVAKSAHSTEGGAELVVNSEKNSDAMLGVKELQTKLSREAAEARKKLEAARKLVAMHSGHTGEEKGVSISKEKIDGLVTWKKPSNSKDKAREKVETTKKDQESDKVERSLVSEYEEKLSRKKQECSELLKEREELRSTHKRLLAIQQKMHLRQLLDDSLLQNPDHEVYSQTDVTAATWGGSTVQSDPEDTVTSVSLPSDIAADITQESNENAGPVHGGGATVEQKESGRENPPPFTVTRHTPRIRPNVRLRTHSQDSIGATQQADKKIKVDPKEKVDSTTRQSGASNNPLAASFKTSFNVKSSDIKKDPNSLKSGDFLSGASLKGNSFGMSGANMDKPLMGRAGNWNGLFLHKDDILAEHTLTLQNQLALTSNMCNQLLYGQNSLIRAVCDHLSHPELHPQVQEHMAMLQQYQLELESYYHQLCASYVQLHEQQQDEVVGRGGAQESEEPVIPSTTVDEATPSQSNVPGALLVNVESAGQQGFPGDPVAAYPPPEPGAHLWNTSIPYLDPYAQYRPLGNTEGVMPSIPAPYLPPPPPPLGNSPNYRLSQSYPAGYSQGLYRSPLPSALGMGTSPMGFQRDVTSPSIVIPSSANFGRANQYLPFLNHGPYPYQHPSMLAQGDFNTSFDNQGLPRFRTVPNHLNLQAAQTTGGFGLVSPSGATASSLQVNAPSSPLSAPSVSMQHFGGGNQPKPSKYSSLKVTSSSVQRQNHPSTVDATAGTESGVKSVSIASASVDEKKKKVGAGKEDSLSSISMDVPDEVNEQGTVEENDPVESTGFSGFDTLRDTIYSEVATLIANNENRPHFLVELFRELQMLSTDYLRQRALYSLQDLVTRFLTEEAVSSEAKAAISKQYQAWLAEADEESGQGEDGESSVVRAKPLLDNRSSQGFDYIEAVNSASSVSTPPNEPFAADDLGDTVIKLDNAMNCVRKNQSESFTLSPLKADETSSHSAVMQYMDYDTEVLDEQIKCIMIDVIPVLKDNIDKVCNSEMVGVITRKILDLVLEQEKNQKQEYFEAFGKQLEVTMNTVMNKYCNKKFRECGEDLLMDVSEALFNELAFFKLMQDFRGHPQLSGDFRSITSSQTTTEGEDNYLYDEDETGAGGAIASARPTYFTEGTEVSGQKMLDPALLQVLSINANLTLQEDEDTLGKSRDDALAATWDPSVPNGGGSSLSASGDEGEPELSVSESQPIQSVNSKDGETVVVEPQANDNSDDRGVTPPTPLAVDPSPLAPNLVDETVVPSSDKDCGIEQVSIISKEGEQSKVDQLLPALSPPVLLSSPQINTLTENDLKARVKSEQSSVEGIDGILASMGEEEGRGSDLGLVGDKDEVDTPISSNGI